MADRVEHADAGFLTTLRQGVPSRKSAVCCPPGPALTYVTPPGLKNTAEQKSARDAGTLSQPCHCTVCGALVRTSLIDKSVVARRQDVRALHNGSLSAGMPLSPS
ncbi:hypothetical protein Bbelb_314610 [Branchiostoma belcheri]|nr:hypothetical protein Bbelb_314610 [Branchiostoma belcheri]